MTNTRCKELFAGEDLGEACANCRFYDESRGTDQAMCRKWKIKDVFEFQQRYPTKDAREKALEEMTYEEIMHLARSCPSTHGSAYYARRAEQIAFRNLIAPIAEDLEKVWRKGMKI